MELLGDLRRFLWRALYVLATSVSTMLFLGLLLIYHPHRESDLVGLRSAHTVSHGLSPKSGVVHLCAEDESQ